MARSRIHRGMAPGLASGVGAGAVGGYVGGHMAMGWATDNKALRQTSLKTIADR